MTAATITDKIESNDPTREDVLLTASDGNTYTSKKFGTVRAAHATLNEDTASLTYPVSCAISGGVVTLHCEGLSAKKIFLTCVGRK